MIQIDIDMPTDCASCWIRQNMGCKIANASGWLNNKRDDKCPLKEQEERINQLEATSVIHNVSFTQIGENNKQIVNNGTMTMTFGK